MSTFSMKRPDQNYNGIDHQKYVTRITKTFYYGKLPKTERLSLPVTELAAELFSEAQRGKSLNRLHLNDASEISRNACVSPCSLIIAMLYLEKLKICNPEYLERISPTDLFLVSLMVSSKYLFDDGENDEVFIDEWAASGGISVTDLAQLEREFLNAIGWEIFVRDISFWRKLNHVETHLAEQEGKRRGFFTYTELMNLAKIIELQSLIQCIVAMVTILAVTYTLGVLSIAGSFHIVRYIQGNPLENVQTISQVAKFDLTIPQENCVNDTEEKILNFESKNVEKVHILSTSLFLASINTFMIPFCNSSCSCDNGISSDNPEENNWEWWNVPSMKWLTENSEEIFHVDMKYLYKYFMSYLEILFMVTNDLDIGNHVNMKKSTKTRLQDQMESSWHKEWIDSLKKEFPYRLYLPNHKL